MRIFGKRGDEIRSVEDWFAKAPPKRGTRHWKDYRSAKELAKSWFRTANAAPPDEFLLFLRRLFPAGEVVLTDGFPECVVALDDFGGEQRNTDLVVLGTAGPQKLAISVEAKADEPFGDQLVGEYYDRRRTVPGSNLPARIDALSQALFNRNLDPRIRSLRYQLLHATAGALISAKQHGADVAISLVHELVSDRLNRVKVASNENDWRSFVAALLPDRGGQFDPEHAIGPLRVAGGGRVPSDVPLYLGKIQTFLP
jgi:hypothetical protein